MKVKIGKDYNEKDVRGVFAVMLKDNFDVITAADRQDKDADHFVMSTAGLVSSVCRLKDEGLPLEEIIIIATNAYKDGWC